MPEVSHQRPLAPKWAHVPIEFHDNLTFVLKSINKFDATDLLLPFFDSIYLESALVHPSRELFQNASAERWYTRELSPLTTTVDPSD